MGLTRGRTQAAFCLKGVASLDNVSQPCLHTRASHDGIEEQRRSAALHENRRRERSTHLTTVDRTHVNVRVIPFSVGAHLAMESSFTILEFAAAPTVVHIEGKRSGQFLEEEADVAVYAAAVAPLDESALDDDQSLALIARTAEELERQ